MANGVAPRVLVADDDSDLRRLVCIHVSTLGYQAIEASDGGEALSLLDSDDISLAILDIMMPKMDGIEVCKQIRDRRLYFPILMLTCRSDEIDKVLALEVGADDYLTKPFSIRELTARIKALVRRSAQWSQATQEESIVCAGRLRINIGNRQVFRDNVPVALTSKEFELLGLLASNPGRSFSRNDLLNRIWDYQTMAYEHTVTSHINRLRSKLEDDPSDPKYILTVWGYGYRFAEEDG